MDFGWHGSWKNRLGNVGAVIGFAGMAVFSFVHDDFEAWCEQIDARMAVGSGWDPTSTLFCIAAALVVGGVGYLIGMAVDSE